MMLPREGYVLSYIFVIVRRFSQTLQAHKLNMIKREKLTRHPRTIWRIWTCDVTPTSRIQLSPSDLAFLFSIPNYPEYGASVRRHFDSHDILTLGPKYRYDLLPRGQNIIQYIDPGVNIWGGQNIVSHWHRTQLKNPVGPPARWCPTCCHQVEAQPDCGPGSEIGTG